MRRLAVTLATNDTKTTNATNAFEKEAGRCAPRRTKAVTQSTAEAKPSSMKPIRNGRMP